MKTLKHAALVALAALALVVGSYEATLAKQAAPRTVHPNAYDAIIRCKGMAEDSAAHVRLVVYQGSSETGGEPRIVYRCKTQGY